MRTIRKNGDGGFHLRMAQTHPPATADEARSRWQSFGHKAKVRNLLLVEQYWLCAYTELRADEEMLGYHIEHLRPKSRYPLETFAYDNLVACALDSDALRHLRAEDLFGGHAKRDNHGSVRFISPLSHDCPKYYEYLSDGRVVASLELSDVEKDRANAMIALLGLNSPFLVNRRRRCWDELDDLFTTHLMERMCIDDLICVDLLPRNGRLQSFFSLVRKFYGPRAEAVLENHAPELL